MLFKRLQLQCIELSLRRSVPDALEETPRVLRRYDISRGGVDGDPSTAYAVTSATHLPGAVGGSMG
jgi:hypothetical protein